ncbi:Uncharacterized protein TPAR_01728 [Tolypocladium paradoxum]|uniref:Uncharacterized protein n=1 Tax=Tolypocladium paradoxum TaxID=94208 RepID=A0A2S4L6Q5_9HYPO|nr:Uncharacterized protein TPAR_01728 [Tolypocladium paradoxum]
MHVAKFLAIAFATVVAAQDVVNDQGVLFLLPAFEGPSQQLISPGECVNLQEPFRDNVHSIKVAPGAQCDFFFEEECESFKDQFNESNPNIEGDPRVGSVRCGPQE